jgi:DNA-binding NarL/FixJ family response regulator
MKEKVENLSSKMERLEWRRNKVLELSSQGHSQPEIARTLQVGLATVNRDLSYLIQQAKVKRKRYIDETARRVREMSSGIDSNPEGSMEYL